MELKHKSFQVASFKAIDEATGIVEAIVSVFNNIDSMNERILPGAFSKSLQRKLPKGVWMHDWTQPIAKTLIAEEWMPNDTRLPDQLLQLGGLYIKGQFNMNTQRGREALSDLIFGTVDEFSIGYFPVKIASSTESSVVDLVEIDLFEWSPVLVGANPATALISAKSPRAGLKYRDEATQALAAVRGFTARTSRLIDVRAKEGREFSAANISQLEEIHNALGEAHQGLGRLLDKTKPKDDGKAANDQADPADVATVLRDFYALQPRIFALQRRH